MRRRLKAALIVDMNKYLCKLQGVNNSIERGRGKAKRKSYCMETENERESSICETKRIYLSLSLN